MEIHRVIGKIPVKTKKGIVLPKHRFTGPYEPFPLQLDSKDNQLPGNEPYNAVDVISYYICYRDNDTPDGKRECDRKMLEELTAGMKHRMGLGIDWNNQLANKIHKPVRRRFNKRTVFANGLQI